MWSFPNTTLSFLSMAVSGTITKGADMDIRPKPGRIFLISKFKRNQINDKLNRDTLEQMGWRVIVVWECELKKDFEGVMKKIADSLRRMN